MRHINHITQPTQDTCTSACIAMATDIPVGEVIEKFHNVHRSKGPVGILDYLDEAGVKYEKADYWARDLKPGLYLVAVPSLNYPGIIHNILVDVFWWEDKFLSWLCYDPQEGNGVRFYTTDEEKVAIHNAVMFGTGYIVEIRFL